MELERVRDWGKEGSSGQRRKRADWLLEGGRSKEGYGGMSVKRVCAYVLRILVKVGL